jgi:hypothetical protein
MVTVILQTEHVSVSKLHELIWNYNSTFLTQIPKHIVHRKCKNIVSEKYA